MTKVIIINETIDLKCEVAQVDPEIIADMKKRIKPEHFSFTSGAVRIAFIDVKKVEGLDVTFEGAFTVGRRTLRLSQDEFEVFMKWFTVWYHADKRDQ